MASKAPTSEGLSPRPTQTGKWTGFWKEKRVVKEQGGKLYFTLPETKAGKAAGLDRFIRGIIKDEGLEVLSLRSTDSKTGKVYAGFDPGKCSEQVARRLIRRLKEEASCRGVKV
jgi:hypothetical protein